MPERRSDAPAAVPPSEEPAAADRLLHGGRHLELRAKGAWEYAHRPNATAIVAVIAAYHGHLVLIEQFRPPVGKTVLEIPAGLVGDTVDGDVPADAAGRELEEETGFRAASLELVTVGPPSAGLSDEVVHFFKATDLTRAGDGGGVDGEEITVHLAPLAGVEAWVRGWAATGDRLVDPKVWTALWFQRDEVPD